MTSCHSHGSRSRWWCSTVCTSSTFGLKGRGVLTTFSLKGRGVVKEGGGSKYNEPSCLIKCTRFSFMNKLYVVSDTGDTGHRVTLKSDIIQMTPRFGNKKKETNEYVIPGGTGSYVRGRGCRGWGTELRFIGNHSWNLGTLNFTSVRRSLREVTQTLWT